jgi:ABC-2 type transport system permease protein
MSTLSTLLFPLIYTLATAMVTLAIAVVGFGLPLHWSTAVLALPAAVLGAVAFMPFGIMIAAATLALKQAQIATNYVIAAISLLAGFYFPVSLLPGWIQWTSKVQPFTPAVDLIRHLLLGSALPAPAWLEVVKLAGFAMVLLPLSALLLSAAVGFGRKRGTITEY